MTVVATASPHPPAPLHEHVDCNAVSPVTPLTFTSSDIVHRYALSSRSPICARPFDKWRPLGGGAQRDIFRRFKIQASEEQDFFAHWTRKQIISGIFNRDEDGTLIFRISSSDIRDLAHLDIARAYMRNESWIHVYDDEGMSWLTQFRFIDLQNLPQSIYDSNGDPLSLEGIVGRYGPSGLTVGDFFYRERACEKKDCSCSVCLSTRSSSE